MNLSNVSSERITFRQMSTIPPKFDSHAPNREDPTSPPRATAQLDTTALDMMRSVIDCLPTGICLVDARGVIVTRNRVADECLTNSDVLKHKQRRLVAERENDQTRLCRALRNVCSPKADAHADYLAMASPVTGGLTTLVVAPFCAAVHGEPDGKGQSPRLALVFIIDTDGDARVGDAALNQLFGLTPSESRLTEALLNGKSVNEYASAASVTVNTARSQLKSIFRKTETCRQADLIQRLGRLFFAVDHCPS